MRCLWKLPPAAVALVCVLAATPVRGEEVVPAAPSAPSTVAPVDEVTRPERPEWLFWLVTGMGVASLAGGSVLFVDYGLIVGPTLDAARLANDNPDVVCPSSQIASKKCFTDQVQRMETAASSDLAVGSFFALAGVGLIAGALVFLYPYGE